MNRIQRFANVHILHNHTEKWKWQFANMCCTYTSMELKCFLNKPRRKSNTSQNTLYTKTSWNILFHWTFERLTPQCQNILFLKKQTKTKDPIKQLTGLIGRTNITVISQDNGSQSAGPVVWCPKLCPEGFLPQFSPSASQDSSVGSVLSLLSCVMQRCGFNPPQSLPIEGIFPLEIAWVLTIS